MTEPLIYDQSVPGRTGVILPGCDVPETPLPTDLMRDDLDLPEVSELQVIRHFVRLSQLNMACSCDIVDSSSLHFVHFNFPVILFSKLT